MNSHDEFGFTTGFVNTGESITFEDESGINEPRVFNLWGSPIESRFDEPNTYVIQHGTTDFPVIVSGVNLVPEPQANITFWGLAFVIVARRRLNS